MVASSTFRFSVAPNLRGKIVAPFSRLIGVECRAIRNADNYNQKRTQSVFSEGLLRYSLSKRCTQCSRKGAAMNAFFRNNTVFSLLSQKTHTRYSLLRSDISFVEVYVAVQRVNFRLNVQSRAQ